MKKLIVSVLMILLTGALIFTACAGPAPAPEPEAPAAPEPEAPAAPAEVITLRFAVFHPATCGIGLLFEDFCKEAEKRTGGRVEVLYYPGATLLKDTEMIDGIKAGIADMGFVPTGRAPGRFPVMDTLSISIGAPTAWSASHAADDFYREMKPPELDDYYIIAVSGRAPECWWLKKPIYKPEDIKGLKIRQAGRMAEVVSALGATPVFIRAPEIYDALSRGVVDGTTFVFEAGKSWRVAEVMPWATQFTGCTTNSAWTVFQSMQSYKKLPPDIQAIWDELSHDWVERCAQMWNDEDIAGWEFAVEMGTKLNYVGPEDSKVWADIIKSTLEKTYFEEMAEKGFAEEEVRGWLDNLQEKYAYWYEKQIELGIKSASGPPEVRLQR